MQASEAEENVRSGCNGKIGNTCSNWEEAGISIGCGCREEMCLLFCSTSFSFCKEVTLVVSFNIARNSNGEGDDRVWGVINLHKADNGVFISIEATTILDTVGCTISSSFFTSCKILSSFGVSIIKPESSKFVSSEACFLTDLPNGK